MKAFTAPTISAKHRLAAFLVDLSERVPSNQAEHVLLPMSQQDIGHYLNLTAETINRLFSQFQKQRLIRIERKKIVLLPKRNPTKHGIRGINVFSQYCIYVSSEV
ncbi:MAG: helix-turn-helix domain-containing protein [Legionellales bacterium]|nr:helix-turn-helix domain-containing protein [Legionellales bacterium]